MSAAEHLLDPYERVCSLLGVDPRTGNVMARCPAHDDSTPSLSVSRGDKGVVFKCFSQGCRAEDIAAALGLNMRELFYDSAKAGEKPVEVARYTYEDEQGWAIYDVIRRSDKTFFQQPANGKRGPGAMDGVRRVPYRLPQCLAAIAEGRQVWIVEGEKDVEALWRAGAAATCNSGGAGKWTDAHTTALVGLREAVVIADKDKPGLAHAKAVAASLRAVGVDVVIAEAATGKDAADHLGAGKGLDEFEIVDEQADGPEPEPEPTGPQTWGDKLHTNILTLDQLRHLPKPRPLIDGLLDRQSLAVTYGPPKSFKSFLVISWAMSVATGSYWQGHAVEQAPVWYVAAEGQADFADRIDAWMVHERIYSPGLLRIVTIPVNLFQPDKVGMFLAEIEASGDQPGLIVFDTLARCAVGADENSFKDMGVIVEQADHVKDVTGACVMLVHHNNRAGTNMRGHSSLDGAVDTAVEVAKDDALITATVAMQKRRADGAMYRFSPAPAGPSVALARYRGQTGDLGKSAVAVLEALVAAAKLAPVSNSTWLKATESVTDRTFYRTKPGLIEQGFVSAVQTAQGEKYAPTAKATDIVLEMENAF